MKKTLYLGIAGLLLSQAATLAMFTVQIPAPMLSIPVDRLLTNTAAYIKEHPDDAMGPYTLARIHYFALATGEESLVSEGQQPLPIVSRTIRGASQPHREKTPAERLQEVTVSVENYRQALTMEPMNPLFHLGLASVSEWALDSGITLGAVPGSAPAATASSEFKTQWREQAIASYRTAFELAAEKDLKLKNRPNDLSELISWEAAIHFRNLVKQRGVAKAEEPFLKKIQKALENLQDKPLPKEPNRKLPRGAVTPIVFRMDGPAPLDALLDSRRIVRFDLDGTKRPQQYRWVRPETAILVWDPSDEGRITSGHQLFGSVTFNMFWSDGYRALDSLDDNRDGELRGRELEGLAVWFDRNQDGVSQPGEVVPIAKTRIEAISARKAGYSGDSPMNPRGLTTTDGSVLPTYDWTTTPLAATPIS